MLVIGHRGAPSLEHENTIKSFKIALSHNVDGLEFDVQHTKDNQLIVYHDFDITYNQKTFQISNLTFQELNNFKLNYKIPTFEEVIQICPSDKIINIEIKSHNIFHKHLITQIINILIKYHLSDNVIISSFNPFVLLELKKQSNKFKIGLLWSNTISEKWYVTRHAYKLLQPYSLHANVQSINTQISHWVRNKGMKLFLYTVNDIQSLQKAHHVGADAIFSDYPQILEK
jgi:glycerophosphoryl diester phosphodiesterase